MDDPYVRLGLTPGATETEARDRYLELVRQFPPERSPEEFASIRAAYEQLASPFERLNRQLFQLSAGKTLAHVKLQLAKEWRSARLSIKQLQQLADG